MINVIAVVRRNIRNVMDNNLSIKIKFKEFGFFKLIVSIMLKSKNEGHFEYKMGSEKS